MQSTPDREAVALSEDRLITEGDLRTMLGGCSHSSVWRWVKAGILPAPLKLGNASRWRYGSALDAIRNLPEALHAPKDAA